jgi:hypothetical protein
VLLTSVEGPAHRRKAAGNCLRMTSICGGKAVPFRKEAPHEPQETQTESALMRHALTPSLLTEITGHVRRAAGFWTICRTVLLYYMKVALVQYGMLQSGLP